MKFQILDTLLRTGADKKSRLLYKGAGVLALSSTVIFLCVSLLLYNDRHQTYLLYSNLIIATKPKTVGHCRGVQKT